MADNQEESDLEMAMRLQREEQEAMFGNFGGQGDSVDTQDDTGSLDGNDGRDRDYVDSTNGQSYIGIDQGMIPSGGGIVVLDAGGGINFVMPGESLPGLTNNNYSVGNQGRTGNDDDSTTRAAQLGVSGNSIERTPSDTMQWLLAQTNSMDSQNPLVTEVAHLRKSTQSVFNVVSRLGPINTMKMRVMHLLGQRAFCQSLLESQDSWDESLIQSQTLLMETSDTIDMLADLFGLTSQTNKPAPKITWDDVMANLFALQDSAADIADPDTLLKDIKKHTVQANKLRKEDLDALDKKRAEAQEAGESSGSDTSLQQITNPNEDTYQTIMSMLASLRAGVAEAKINQLSERLQHYEEQQNAQIASFETNYADQAKALSSADLLSSTETRLGMLFSQLYAIKEELEECHKLAQDADVENNSTNMTQRVQDLVDSWQTIDSAFLENLVPLFDAKTQTMRGNINQYQIDNGSSACTTISAHAAMGLLSPVITQVADQMSLTELRESGLLTPHMMDDWVRSGVEAHPVSGLDMHLGWTLGIDELDIPSVSETYKNTLETVQEQQGTTDSSEEMNLANIVASVSVPAPYGLVLTCNGMSVIAIKLAGGAWLFFDSHGMPNVGVQQTYLRKFDTDQQLLQFLEKRFPYMAVPDLGSSIMFNTVSAFTIQWDGEDADAQYDEFV